MNDDLQPLKNRLRWLNRSILILGVLILLCLIFWAMLGLRKLEPGTTSTVIHSASSVSDIATRESPAAVSAVPKPAMSTVQEGRAAAAAIDALPAASAPRAATGASQAAAHAGLPAIAPSPASTAGASAPVKEQTAVDESASSATQAAAQPKPLPRTPAAKHRPAERKPAVHAKTKPARATHFAVKPQRVGAVSVCRAEGWYVQVGAFGKQQSIDRLAQKLHAAGYARVCVVAQPVRGLHLFYVGPYKSAAAARDARSPLHKLTMAEGVLRKLD